MSMDDLGLSTNGTKKCLNAPWSEQLTFSSESSSVWSVSTNAAGWRNCNRRWIEQVKMINSRLLQFYNVGQCVTIQAAAGATGYDLQYLMRLLRAEKITWSQDWTGVADRI